MTHIGSKSIKILRFRGGQMAKSYTRYGLKRECALTLFVSRPKTLLVSRHKALWLCVLFVLISMYFIPCPIDKKNSNY